MKMLAKFYGNSEVFWPKFFGNFVKIQKKIAKLLFFLSFD